MYFLEVEIQYSVPKKLNRSFDVNVTVVGVVVFVWLLSKQFSWNLVPGVN